MSRALSEFGSVAVGVISSGCFSGLFARGGVGCSIVVSGISAIGGVGVRATLVLGGSVGGVFLIVGGGGRSSVCVLISTVGVRGSSMLLMVLVRQLDRLLPAKLDRSVLLRNVEFLKVL